jgi:hypothetical protein
MKNLVFALIFPLALACASQAHARAPVEVAVIDLGEQTYVFSSILKEVYKQADLELKVTVLPRTRATIDVTTGRIDGEVGRLKAYGEDRPMLIRVEPALGTVTFTAFYLKSSKVSIKTKRP